MCVKHRGNATNGFPHQLKPGERQSSIRLCVIKRNNLVFENVKQAVDVDFRLKLDAAAFDFRSNRPTISSAVTFAPPAIENAKIQATVWRQLHAAGAASFQWPKGIIQPNINSLVKPATDIGILVFNE